MIIGEAGTGKTRLTQKLLCEALEDGEPGITVIDLAPKKIVFENESIGGHLDKSDPRIRYLAPEDVKAPRLTAKNPEELIEFAERNRRNIDSILNQFSTNPSEILFVNDASIYLQAGDSNKLWTVMSKAKTLIINAYLGEKLKNDQGTGISARERSQVISLASRMDKVINL